MKSLKIDMLTPAARIVSGVFASATLPLQGGEAQVLPGAAPWVAEIGVGHLVLLGSEGKKMDFFVDGGYLEVVDGEHCKILASNCEPAQNIDGERARKALERAEKRIVDKGQLDVDVARAMYAKLRAQGRLKTLKR